MHLVPVASMQCDRPERDRKLHRCYLDLLANRLDLCREARVALEQAAGVAVEFVGEKAVEGPRQEGCVLCALALGEASKAEVERALKRPRYLEEFEAAVLALRGHPRTVFAIAHNFMMAALRRRRQAA